MKNAFAFLLLFTALLTAHAEPVQHRLLVNGFSHGTIYVVAADGSVEREITGFPWVQDSWLLENGNYLFSYKTGVKEVASDLSTVWEYKSLGKVELHSVQPLENGNVLASECGTKRLIEIDRTGQIVKEIPLQSNMGRHVQFRTARKTPQGTYWVAFIGESKVKEVDENGAVLREWATGTKKNQAHGLDLLPNGNLLASTAHGHGVKEFDSTGTVVWELTEQDLLSAGVKEAGYVGGVKRLPNGNTVLAVYHGNPQLIEVNPDKQIVWQFYNEAFEYVASFHLLD